MGSGDSAQYVMKTIRTLMATAVAVTALALVGCNAQTNQDVAKVDTTNTVQASTTTPANLTTAQQNAGVYSGVLPAADCEGIRTTLYIRPDGTYTRISEYIGAETFEEGGTWKTDDKGVTHMKPSNNQSPEWLMGFEETEVILLDADGNQVTGPLADKYRLKKN